MFKNYKSRLLYLGSLGDLKPLILFENIKTFVYVDPNGDNNILWNRIKEVGYVIKRIIKKGNRCDIYFTNDQRIKYFFKYFPESDTKLNKNIKKCNSLYLCGYYPYFQELKTLKHIPTLYCEKEDILYYKKKGYDLKTEFKNIIILKPIEWHKKYDDVKFKNRVELFSNGRSIYLCVVSNRLKQFEIKLNNICKKNNFCYEISKEINEIETVYLVRIQLTKFKNDKKVISSILNYFLNVYKYDVW